MQRKTGSKIKKTKRRSAIPTIHDKPRVIPTPATISKQAIDASFVEKLEDLNVTDKCDELAGTEQITAATAITDLKVHPETEISDVDVVSADLSLINNNVDTVKTSATASSTAVVANNSTNTNTREQEVVTSKFDAFKQIPTAKSVADAAAIDTNNPLIRASENIQPLKPFSGIRFYNRDKLISLRDVPASHMKPSNEIVKRIEKFYSQQRHNGNTNNFHQQAKQSQQINHDKRPLQNAQQDGCQQNNHGNGMIHISLSLREDVKLNVTVNAWKPTFYETDSRNNNTTESLYKRVRGILNKLTPEKFDTLLGQMTELNIDSVEQLNKVIVLVFEKAIDELNFSAAYALLCQQISAKWLMDDFNRKTESENPSASATGTSNDIQVEDKINEAENVGQQALFKKSLITKCQIEFINHVDNDEAIYGMLEPFRQNVEQATDLELRAEYMTVLDEEERRLRRRSVGTVKFIGELYKINMLTTTIMTWCVDTLLREENEYKLECLCKLLTTVGQKMESKTNDPDQKTCNLSQYFKKMQLIVKGHKVSSRVRFMLQDVIDLRKSNWTRRQIDLKPKTMGQIQREAEKEQKNIHFLNYAVPGSGRNDDRVAGGGQSDYTTGDSYSQNKSRVGRGDGNSGWSPVQKSRRIPVDRNKLSKSINDDSTTLGLSSQYKWNRRQAPTLPTPLGNKYSALDGDSTIGGSFGRHNSNDQYHSKGSRGRDSYNCRNSHSGLQYNSREYSSARNVTLPSSVSRGMPSSSQRSATSKSMHGISSHQQHTVIHVEHQTFQQRAEPDQNSIDSIKALTKGLLLAHMIGEIQLADSHIELDAIEKAFRWAAVRELHNFSIEHSRLQPRDRMFAGQVCCHWIATKTITVTDYLRALRDFFEFVDELSVDIPKIWQYIAECVTPLLKDKHVTFRDVISVKFTKIHVCSELLRAILSHLLFEHGPQFVRDLWGDCEWSEFMPAENVAVFVCANQFEFVTNKAAAGHVSNLEKVHGRIKFFLTEETESDGFFEYISKNVANIDNHFIRTLTTVVVVHALAPKTHSLNDNNFKKGIVLLNRYIDNNEHHEVECLIAIQILITKLEHPSGLLQKLMSILLEEDTISVDGIKKWRYTTEEPEGKGVAVKCLNSFFTQLEESQSESSSEEDV